MSEVYPGQVLAGKYRIERVLGQGGMGVVVEGRYHRDGVFHSTNLMVKHSNEYRKPEHGERPQDMYRSLQKESGT